MAKVKQPTYEDTALPPEAPAVEAPEAAAEPAAPVEKPAAKKDKKTEADPAGEPDTLALGVLRAFPNYPTLYVDRQGGAFPPDTLPAIRAGAVLYRNPFHKS